MKSNKQAYVDFILDQLRAGNVLASSVFTIFYQKFPVTRKTFGKYWDLAQIKYREHCDIVNKAVTDKTITEEVSAARGAILKKKDMLQIASDIANDEFAAKSDRIRAMDFIVKIRGFYAPTKIAHTDKSGNDKPDVLIASVQDATDG